MAVHNLSLTTFFQRVLDPIIVVGTLHACALEFNEPFSGNCLISMVAAFFISTAIRQYIDPYTTWRSRRVWADARDTLLVWCMTVILLMLLGTATVLGQSYEPRVVLFWFITTLIILLANHFAGRSIRRPDDSREVRSVIVVGADNVSAIFAGVCERQPNFLLQVSGFFADRTSERHSADQHHPVLGRRSDLVQYMRCQAIRMIFVGELVYAQPHVLSMIDALHDTTPSAYFLPNLYGFNVIQVRVDLVGGMRVNTVCETPFVGIYSAIKRITDILLSYLILTALTPLMLAIAFRVKLKLPKPVIFRQRRYGLDRKGIVYKFRSILVMEPGSTVIQMPKNVPPLTPHGTFSRYRSLNELPQLVNALEARMSIVGPRPDAIAHIEMYRKLIKGYLLRHAVKLGITGRTQVNGLFGKTKISDEIQARSRYHLDSCATGLRGLTFTF
jgi:putative colanic acid biosynthesis UDP-glucose lipid carrier transferase